jgi:hypothetical protein
MVPVHELLQHALDTRDTGTTTDQNKVVDLRLKRVQQKNEIEINTGTKCRSERKSTAVREACSKMDSSGLVTNGNKSEVRVWNCS